MATGRTLLKWTQVFMDGYALCGYGRSIGPLKQEYQEADLTGWCNDVMGYLPNQASLGIGEYNGVLDTTATVGLHAVLGTPGTYRNIMVPIGIRGTVAAGDPVYMGRFEQLAYQAAEDGGAMVVNIPFGEWDAAGMINYSKPWGVMLHANSAATAANTSAGIDDRGAATAAGGWLMYQVTAGDGTATISIDDSANNSDWTALSGATSGSIDCSSVQHGIVALGTTATVRRYLRWQIALGTANTVTFALAFVRI